MARPAADPGFDLATAAVEAALGAGASYADARTVIRREESLHAQDGQLDDATRTESAGVGVRALLGSSWGFAATSDLTAEAVRQAGAQATATARASARVGGPALELADVPAAEDDYETPHVRDPFTVPLSEKADVIVAATSAMLEEAAVSVATGVLGFWDTHSWFVSSQGHRIHQHIVESGGGITALAVGEAETQVRSYPQSRGEYRTGGYEVVTALDLAGNAARVASEAAALLTAEPCPEGRMDVILEGSQLALQIHESVGHATELDRILGWEAAFAGTSFLDLDALGTLRYGSELMTITADATLPGGLGTFGYDDEGTPAQCVELVTEGRWVGVLSGRDSAHLAGLRPGGMVRGDGFARLPMVRMTNVGLLPGDSSLEAMIAATERGVYLATNRSWSIDDRRLNFQFGCEIGWEIRDGELGRMLKNPTYTGITPAFWGSMDIVAGPDEWWVWGTPNCGKGQPMQVGHTGHHCAPARFRDVRVGVRG